MFIRSAHLPTTATLAALSLAALTACGATGAESQSGSAPASPSASAPDAASDALFASLEQEFDARLGVYAIDTGTGEEVFYRADERFAYASTHKALSAGALLDQYTLEEMEVTVTYTEDDLVEYSPITEEHVDTGMTRMEIIDASVRYSDNTAGNLVLEELGGVEAFKEDLRAIGDEVSEPARYETELNEATPGDIRDTSTPRAMAESLRAYTLEDVLPEEKRDVLIDLLVRNTTGDETIRAGVPEGWIVGDKTGSAAYGGRNDIALAWPEEGADPIIISVFSSQDEQDAEPINALVAEATEVVVDTLG
ncbi:class A beta-lactamase [Nocardiopsis lambiniae]|uniref:Beta-lactamase n=1 Tax=Nocardiopsis lambiniae TaxID=3075539 RepID=A0ABU2MBR8_9ACTN|nr:class A beta-lactamase [Nocardiopsis sp. DSM 44743]MDT0330113.1 class A beta-lactamase [Nocardiopsis sp. DSM 44743]